MDDSMMTELAGNELMGIARRAAEAYLDYPNEPSVEAMWRYLGDDDSWATYITAAHPDVDPEGAPLWNVIRAMRMGIISGVYMGARTLANVMSDNKGDRK